MSNDTQKSFRIHPPPPPMPHPNSPKKNKSAYILALVHKQDFIDIGAKPIQQDVSYFIPRQYSPDGSPYYETCGILGLKANCYHALNNQSSVILRRIKESHLLSDVQSIENITAKKIATPLSRFDPFLRSQDEEILLLFNIEPKGVGIFSRIYPFPQITLPGGTMEPQDEDDFLRCAFREFQEETGLDISCCSTIIHNEMLQQLRHKYQNTNSHFTYNATFPERMHTSMYFLCLTNWLPPPGIIPASEEGFY